MRKKSPIGPKKRVLILRSGALGDTLMLLPGLAALPNPVEIFVAGRLPGLEFLKPFTSRCLDYESSGWHRLFSENPEPLPRPPWPQADEVIAFSAGPAGRLQPNLEFYFPHAGIHLFPAFPEQGRDLHVALYLAQCLAEAGLTLNPQQAFAVAQQKALLNPDSPQSKTQTLVFHPGSGSGQKNLGAEFWLPLIKTLGRNSGPFKPVLLLGPAEQAMRPYFEKTQTEHGAQIVFCPENPDLIETLKGAALYIGHDSGITHLAAMLGRPSIALFRNSSVTQWRPLGPKVTVIEAQEPLDGVMDQVLWMAQSFLSKENEE